MGQGRALPWRSTLLGDTGRGPYLRYSLVLEGHQASRIPFLRKHPLPHPQPKIPQKQDRIMFQVGAGVGEDEFWQKGNQEIGQGEEEDRWKGTGGQYCCTPLTKLTDEPFNRLKNQNRVALSSVTSMNARTVSTTTRPPPSPSGLPRAMEAGGPGSSGILWVIGRRGWSCELPPQAPRLKIWQLSSFAEPR